ncbi:MAG: DUF5658 family protein [Candidatus Aminicenantales bacterium]|jgi:hypothetical protein
MTRKALAIVAVFVASFGLLRAEDSPGEVLFATALAPPTVINLTPAPAPALPGLKFESLSFAPQTGFAIVSPFGGFKPSGVPGKSLFDVNLLAMVGLNISDYVSTRAALKYPGLHESNPLMMPFVKSRAAFAAVKLGTTALTYLSLKAIFKKNKTVAWVLATASNVLLSYVVANNMQMIHQARAH